MLIPEAQAPLDNQSEWAGRYYTLLDGVPVARYAGETGWTPLGPAVAPPREWEYEDLAGRDTATTLFGEPGISMQMVDAQNGWLAATYGHGVGGADTYVYRTHDGGGLGRRQDNSYRRHGGPAKPRSLITSTPSSPSDVSTVLPS